MTLFMDAARAAFNSSYTINSVKRNIARFCPMDHDRKLFFLSVQFCFYTKLQAKAVEVNSYQKAEAFAIDLFYKNIYSIG